MHKLKFSKMLAVMLALMLTTGIFLSPISDIMSITVYADTGTSSGGSSGGGTGSSANDRDHEGKKNASEDVDFWNDINIDQSFAYQVRMATNYANRMAAGDVKIGNGSYDGGIKFNNIAPFFGYTSGEINTDILVSPSKSRGGNTSASSVSYSRALLRSYTNYSSTNPASRYGDYGLMLNLMGFDNTGSAAENSRRSVFGVIALGAYYAAGSVNSLFEIMFNILESTNPFQFFKDINSVSTLGQKELESISDAAVKASDGGDKALGTLTTYIGNIFNAFADFSWSVAIPLSLVFIIVAVFLTRNGKYRFASNIKKFFIRIIFLILGIPILGSAYTQVLDSLKDSRVMTDDFMTQAISYTFLDFGEWVENRRLAPADGDTYRIGTLSESDDTVEGGTSYIAPYTWFHIREMCSNLNEQNGVFTLGTKYLTVNKDTGAMLKDYMYNTSGATMATDAKSASLSVMDTSNKEAILGVITSYMHGTKYTAEMFETGTVANMIKLGGAYGDMLALSCDKYSFSQNAERQVHGLQTDTTGYYDPAEPDKAKPYSEVAKARFTQNQFAGMEYNIWINGNLEDNAWDAAGGVSGSGAPTYGVKFTTGGGSFEAGKDIGLNPRENMGFSTMAMYTYLTTQFTQDGLIVYGDAPSDYTQTCHYSVNLIGGSYIMQFAFFANMVTLLVSYFVLALVFVFRTAFDILIKGVHLIGQSLLAAVGFYKSIGTAICMTISMIAQLFVSVIFFSFMADLMFIMTSLGDHFFRKVIEAAKITVSGSNLDGGTATSSFQAEVLVLTSTLLSSLILIFFLFFAIRWRAAIMNAINSTVENIVGTLLGVSLSGASDGGTSGMLKGALNDTLNVAGVAAGAGAAVGLVGEASDMVDDIRNSAADEDGAPARPLQGFDSEPKSAVDGAVDATVGAGFDGGKGKVEGDSEITKAEAEELLANGIEDKGSRSGGSGGKFGDESNHSSGKFGDEISSSRHDEKLNETKNDDSFHGYYYGSSADGAIPVRDADGNIIDKTHTDENGNTILNRNGKGSESKTGEGSDSDSGLEVGIDTKGGIKLSKGSASSNGVTDDSTSGAASSSDKKTTNETTIKNATETKGTEVETQSVESSVTEDEQGVLWQQTNAETGTTTAARFDAARGLVIGMTDENGNVSDVAIGMNGISTATTDDAGNKQVTTFNKNGMQSSYTGVDGTTETVTADFDSSNPNVTVNRTDANGNTEEIVTDMNGTTKSRTETAADGSTRTVVTDDSGAQTITEKNATTGYESTETISAIGESVKTESVNGVTTVTNTDAEGNITSQSSTKFDANGNEVVTSYSMGDNGEVISATMANGVTEKTITGADGSRTEVQSVVKSDGTIVETTTDYGTDAVADSVKTVVKSANGMEVIGTSESSSGTDAIGTYTGSVVSTGSGTLEIKDYGGGHIISTETANGVETVSELKSDGSRVITETDTASGNVSVTNLSAKGEGETVVRSSAGETIAQNKITADSSGTSTYTTMSGGSITFSTVGEGADRESVVAQTYATGGQNVVATNIKTGNQTVTASDAFGSQTVTDFDAKSGVVKTQFVHVSGNAGQSILDSDGSFSQNVTMMGGGSQSIVRNGTGSSAVEVVTKQDAAGNMSVIQSTGGRIDYVEATSGSNTSFVQQRAEDGSLVTRQTLESGAVVNRVAQSNGDYTQETINTNGSRSYIESTGGNITRRDVSITGIETTAMRSGSATTETVNYESVSFMNANDGKGVSTATFRTTTGQTYSVMNDAVDNSNKTVVELGDGNSMSYKQNADSSGVYIVKNASGSGRIENIASNGTSNVVYVDAQGSPVAAPQGADTYNDAMASAFKSFSANNAGIQMPTQAANQRVYYGTDFNAERQGSLNFAAGDSASAQSIVIPTQNVGAQRVNVEYSDTVSQNGVTFNGMSGMMATGTAATVPNTELDTDVESVSTMNVRVHSNKKVKNFLENLFGNMVNVEEETDTVTQAAANDGASGRRTLGEKSDVSKLRRNPGAGMGDYATRRGGSTTGDKK